MFPFTIYLVTALATGVQVHWLLMWAIWGAPTHPVQFISLGGSFVLLLASFVALFRPRAAAVIAIVGSLAIFTYYVPAVVVSLQQLTLWHLPLLPLAFFPVILLCSTTIYAAAVLKRSEVLQRRPWMLPRSATPRQRRIVGVSVAAFVAAVLLVNRFAIGIERTIIEPAKWNYTDSTDERGIREIHLRFVHYPKCFERFYSRELADYLEKRGDQQVPVTLVITSDFGEVRGISVRSVGDFKDMSGWRGGGAEGQNPKCPW
jgi:hypothetical protein